MLNKCGIYKITNTITGDFYIGSAVNLHRRFGEHWRRLVGNRHHNIHLQRAWNKYGEQSFEFSIVLLCDTKHQLLLEQGFLDLLKPAYNISKDATAVMQGLRHSKEACAKMSEAKKGNIYNLGHIATEETRAKMSEAHKGNTNSLGHKCTEERKRKISEEHKGKPNGQLGRHPSEETRKKLSEALKGNTYNLGHKRNEETRAKMSEAQKLRWAEQKKLILPLDNQI